MKAHARAVVIGGGVIGCSVAYHLTEMGWTDIVLVDKGELTSGSTFHSAGLVGQLRSSVTLTRMMMYGTSLYGRLKDETGYDPGWHPVGSLRLASSPARREDLRRQVAWAKTFGLPLEPIGIREAMDLFPLLTDEGLLGAIYLPTDGWVDPTGLTQALAVGARKRGAAIHTGVRVLEIRTTNGRVSEVVTDHGAIRTEVVVNAAGIWAQRIGAMVGVNVPIIPMAHQYLITKPIPGHEVPRTAPVVRDPDLLLYLRGEVGGLIVGGFETRPAAWSIEGPPWEFHDQVLPPDWERFEEIQKGALTRTPCVEGAEVTQLINGPEAYTPDGEFILGESPEVRGFFVAAGLCAHGIAGGGGTGKSLAEWIVEGEPSLDMHHMDIRRFGTRFASRAYTLDRVMEVYKHYYLMRFPFDEHERGRPLRTSPAYERLKGLGCVFGEKNGWERPNYFRPGQPWRQAVREQTDWGRPPYFEAVGREHAAARERAALFDESSFSKLEVSGPGAFGLLQRLIANDLDRPVGTVTYTSLLTRKGGIECDLTVTRLTADRFLLITGTAWGPHDLGWIQLHMPRDGSVQARDVTSSLATFGLWGPRARDILRQVTDDDISHEGFQYMTARPIVVGRVPVLALRVTYVGELGWELYVASEYGLTLWDTLWEAGQAFGMTAGGYKAIDSLRLEKGYRVWGVDLTPDDNPYEAGLGPFVKLDKGDFMGREALIRVKQEGIKRKLCALTLPGEAGVIYGNEPVHADGKVVGRVRSGGFGYTLGTNIALAYLPTEHARPGTQVAVEMFGAQVPALVQKEPLFDPKNERIKS
jgi:4-methylaminobutanoate oxidase (formaldehyde-forming)